MFERGGSESSGSESRLVLREIVEQATAALSRMDASRLEELVLCCRDLNQDLNQDLSRDLNRDLSQDLNRDRDPELLPDLLAKPSLDANSGPASGAISARARWAMEARDAQTAMLLLGRVLEETRANLRVLTRLSGVAVAGRPPLSGYGPADPGASGYGLDGYPAAWSKRFSCVWNLSLTQDLDSRARPARTYPDRTGTKRKDTYGDD